MLWSFLIPRIRDQVAHHLPASLGSFEHPEMGGMPGAHRFTGGHQLTTTFYACFHEGHIGAKESDLLTNQGVPSGHGKRRREYPPKRGLELSPAPAPHPKDVRPVSIVGVVPHGEVRILSLPRRHPILDGSLNGSSILQWQFDPQSS